jgi:hypothetical protein
VQHAARLLQDFEEAATIVRVTAEIVVDQGARVPQRRAACVPSSPAARDASASAGRLREEPPVLFEDFLVDHIEQIVGILEAFIDRLCGRVGRRRDRGADIQQQDGVDLRDFLGRAIVLLHQPLAGGGSRSR